MRFSTVSVGLLAGFVAAVPQVQPISQISDGQIQAPPATSKPVTASSVVPSGPAASTPAYSAPVVPPPVLSTSAVVRPTSTITLIVPANSTISASSAPASSKPAASQTSAGASSKTSGGIPQQATNAAADNTLSFGGLVFALAAAVFA